jgi:hypothetical protein
MKLFPTLPVIVCLTAGIVAWQVFDRDRPSSNEPGSATGTKLTSSAGSSQTPARSTLPQPDEAPEVVTAAQNPAAKSDDPPCIPDTRWIEHPVTGEMVESERCLSNDAADPYEFWDDATLVGMAYGDARAAEVLGLRHIRSTDPDTEAMGLALLYRSVALSGDPETFRKAIGARYAYLSINGEPQIHNLKQQLMFTLVGQTMGYEWFRPGPVIRKLQDAGVSATDIAAARLVARQILETMADLQTEMTGESGLRESLKEGALSDA